MIDIIEAGIEIVQASNEPINDEGLHEKLLAVGVLDECLKEFAMVSFPFCFIRCLLYAI